MTAKQTILFDIDGTLASIDHRRVFLEQDPPDWKSFNAAMGDDTPNENIVNLYRVLRDSQKYEIIIVTGRNERFRPITETWLTWNTIEFERLLMRADKDMRADHIIKEEILDQLLNEGKDIAFTIDDRQQVVDMWRRRGISCLQCDVGDF